MIAASLKAAEGDKIIDLLLRKGADVSVKSNSGQVGLPLHVEISGVLMLTPHRMLCTLRVPKPISPRYERYSPTSVAPASKTSVASYLSTERQQSALFRLSRLFWKKGGVPSMRRIMMG